MPDDVRGMVESVMCIEEWLPKLFSTNEGVVGDSNKSEVRNPTM